MPIQLNTSDSVAKEFPKAWDITSGPWGKIARKHFGAFIATVFSLHGNSKVRWRVKQIALVADASINSDIKKVYVHKCAGQASGMIEAMRFIEKNAIPVQISLASIKEAIKDGIRDVG